MLSNLREFYTIKGLGRQVFLSAVKEPGIRFLFMGLRLSGQKKSAAKHHSTAVKCRHYPACYSISIIIHILNAFIFLTLSPRTTHPSFDHF